MRLNYRRLKDSPRDEDTQPLEVGKQYIICRTTVCYIYDPAMRSVQLGWVPMSEFRDYEELGSGEEYYCTIIDSRTLELQHRYEEAYKCKLANNQKPKKVNMLTQVLETNKAAMKQAAYLEAGRVATSTLQTIVASRFPNLPDTPFNALILANLADVMGKQIKPSAQLQKVTQAMVTSAYTDLFQGLDIDGMIAELLTATKDMDIEDSSGCFTPLYPNDSSQH